MLDLSKLKAGQCVRLRKHVIAAFQGARAMAFEQNRSLYPKDMTEADINRPTYVHLRITEVSAKRITGVDMETLAERAFAIEAGGKLLEVDPTPEKRILDFWGWDEVVRLSAPAVRALVKEHHTRLDKQAKEMTHKANAYRLKAGKVLKVSLPA